MARAAAKAVTDAEETEDAAPAASSDATADIIQSKFDEAHAKGYFGSSPDPFPNEAYSLATGPKAPSAAEQLAAVQPANTPKEG